MKTYTFHVTFPESIVTVTKQLKNDKDAKFWGQLCLDICGKDEHGRKYLEAVLRDGATGEIVKAW